MSKRGIEGGEASGRGGNDVVDLLEEITHHKIAGPIGLWIKTFSSSGLPLYC